MLVNLNPAINAWYVLKVAWQDGSESSYHLENPEPRSRKSLDSKYPLGIEIWRERLNIPAISLARVPGSGEKLATDLRAVM